MLLLRFDGALFRLSAQPGVDAIVPVAPRSGPGSRLFIMPPLFGVYRAEPAANHLAELHKHHRPSLVAAQIKEAKILAFPHLAAQHGQLGYQDR